jgi:DNA uptake protein ComE-like DNA-binding protein
VFIYLGLERWRRPLIVGTQPAIEPDRIAQVETRVDPNVATWAELARLPDVGESLAREIVTYREDQRAKAGTTATPNTIFRSLKDLDPIPGIGEKTLEKIAPFLKFPN